MTDRFRARYTRTTRCHAPIVRVAGIIIGLGCIMIDAHFHHDTPGALWIIGAISLMIGAAAGKWERV